MDLGRKDMLNKICYIFSLIAFLLRIVLIDFDGETMEIFFGGIYYPSLSKIGNDYYLTSIMTIMYFLSSFILILPFKRRNNVKVCSVVILLIASVMETNLFYLYTKMNMFVSSLLYEGRLVLICSIMLLLGYIFLFKKNNKKALKFVAGASFALYLFFGGWIIYNQLSTDVSTFLSILLTLLSHFIAQENSPKGELGMD